MLTIAIVAASMQALRMASFMSQPTLLGIQTLVMMGPYLTNSGRFLDAWTLFGTTIRVAQSIGLHRDPKLLDPAPPLRESLIRRTLWWWMLHMDQQYSVTLGRPLGISGIGDCPPPEPLAPNPTILRLGEFVDQFTLLARQILSSDSMLSVAKIDEFTDRLLSLWDSMPEALQFNESWLQASTQLPDWPLEVMSATLFAKVQSFLVLLNRQRVERTQSTALNQPGPDGLARTVMYQASMGTYPTAFPGLEQLLHPATVRGRDLVINSCVHILQTFLFFYHRNPAVLICWTMGQQAFNACMILIIDAWETEKSHNQWLVDQAHTVFNDLAQKGVHKLAKLAVQRLSDGIAQLGQRDEQRRRAALSRRSSAQQQQPMLQLDTATLTDWSTDAVMGNTGMFLLEDPGLQSLSQQPYEPLGWNMAGSAFTTGQSDLPAPNVPASSVPISQVTAAPFPVLSPSFIPGVIPVTNSPYSIGLQHRMPTMRRTSAYQQPLGIVPPHSTFTPINPQYSQLPDQELLQQVQPAFTQPRGSRTSQVGNNPIAGIGGGPRGIHKLDRTPGRSHQRRK
jgi:hypothetical protein